MAFGQQSGTVRAALGGAYQQLLAQPDFELAPLDLDRLAPRPHCGDRLLELVRDDGKEMIRQQEQDEQWIMPLLVGQREGRWQVLGM